DTGIEDIGCPAALRIELGAVLTAVDAGGTERLHERLQREHLLDAGEIASDGADALAIRRADLRRNGRERFAPRCRHQPAVLADIGRIEALRPEAVPDEAGLVGDPLLVHRLVHARHDAHHLAATRI